MAFLVFFESLARGLYYASKIKMKFMGYMKHHGMAITSDNKELLLKVRNEAIHIFGNDNLLTDIVSSPLGGYSSFFVAPDGSYEGYEESDLGNRHRALLLTYINTLSTDEGDGNWYSDVRYCLFSYGSDSDKDDSAVLLSN